MIFSLRLGDTAHLNQNYIDELIMTLKDSGGCFDEIWLASSYGLLSIEQCEENAKFMNITSEKFKEAGIVASMQVSRTIGHTPGSLITRGQDGIRGLDVNYITNNIKEHSKFNVMFILNCSLRFNFEKFLSLAFFCLIPFLV